MAEVYTPGELQLVYDLVKEHPRELFVSHSSDHGIIRVKLECTNLELSKYVEWMVDRLRTCRQYVEHTVVYAEDKSKVSQE